jgi:CRISPR-associated protein Cpf1
MVESIFSDFTGQYNLVKTLRFELKPVGATAEWIEKKDLLKEDEQRALDYKEMKKIIDLYHKDFISRVLATVPGLTGLKEYYTLYKTPKEKRDEKKFEKIQDALRREIAGLFKKDEQYSKLFKKELIQELLPEFIAQEADSTNQELVAKFQRWTTYFTGFNENRANMYTDEKESTAIAYRLVHENLPKFIDNLEIYALVKKNKIAVSVLTKELSEELSGNTLEQVFSLNYFGKVLAQEGIDTYNTVLGGKTAADGKTKLKGLNEYINLFNQQQEDRSKRLPRCKPLYKQILSDRQSASFLPENFENDSELLDAINDFYKVNLLNYKIDAKKYDVLIEVKKLLQNISSYSADRIYLRNDTGLTDISVRLFQDWAVISKALADSYDRIVKVKGKKLTRNEQEKLARRKYISLAEIQKALADKYSDDSDTKDYAAKFQNYFKNYFLHYDDKNKRFTTNTLDYQIKSEYKGLEGLLNTKNTDSNLRQDKKSIAKIKSFLDSLQELFWFIRPLDLPASAGLEKDENFYGELAVLLDALKPITTLYNKTRNYLTKKPYSVEKFKLNFDNSTLLDGWDVNKQTANSGILLKKADVYFLAIMDKQHNNVFEADVLARQPHKAAVNKYQKIDYKLLPGASKMLPKVFFSDKNIDYYKPDQDILKIRNYGTHTRNGSAQPGFSKREFKISDCRKMIDFFKASIARHEAWQNFGFQFQPTKNYDSIDEFYREVAEQGYKITYTDVADSYVDTLVKEGKIYLFQIYSKDFSENKKKQGRDNLHTMYWKALFAPENLKDVVYKLNGQAEVFYRKRSIEKNIIIHRKNEILKSKNPCTPDKTSKFAYDLIKDRRFTVDKFFFHVPITLNFKARDAYLFNDRVNDAMRGGKNIKIIGLDRGERNLIYLALIDEQGNIIKQEALNDIISDNGKMRTPYRDLLAVKEAERDQARKSWTTIENIKELKAGYLSQVVHKIAKLMIEHNAIVVLEDLNFGFKRGRFKVEKQVYQKFEKMLIDKLNYLVFKDKDFKENGGLYKAYQLTNKFTSFKELGKQTGFLFYVPAWNTSKIDPTTGFVGFLKPRYESVKLSKEFFRKFDSIRYNKTKDYFEFAFDYENFTDRASGSRTKWTVCTHGRERYYFNVQTRNTEKIDVTAALKELFKKYKLDYADGQDIKNKIVAVEEKEFQAGLMKLLSIVLALRYSDSASEQDFILSPVLNEQGKFFNSKEAGSVLPKNADANGAYHIALKGLWAVRQIQRSKTGEKLNLAISNKDWLNFVQRKEYN